MLDTHNRHNHGWIARPHTTPVTATQLAPKGSEYPEGTLLRQCKAGCDKWVPVGVSFHFEECPKQS